MIQQKSRAWQVEGKDLDTSLSLDAIITSSEVIQSVIEEYIQVER